uniref:U-scoloptoxin(16)-Er8a n=1 Tax=Ethmostigmus rubripes TaxID=62613 RepID=TXG8A_ETHRU|nr:RecName: Full=U-scoloptoxin(16)-Er8a; Short=U-SLPTX(16)-Er8a; Flags: Precursor [Ethmostigmus rubripes]
MTSTRKLSVSCLIVFMVSSLIAVSSGWLSSTGKSPLKIGKCDPKNGNLYAIGRKWYNDEDCFEITCIQGDKGSVAQQVASCPVHAVKPGCELVFPGGTYPKCCPYYECPNS